MENNVLILEIDNRGILAKKDFIDLNDMKELKKENQEQKEILKKIMNLLDKKWFNFLYYDLSYILSICFNFV